MREYQIRFSVPSHKAGSFSSSPVGPIIDVVRARDAVQAVQKFFVVNDRRNGGDYLQIKFVEPVGARS